MRTSTLLLVAVVLLCVVAIIDAGKKPKKNTASGKKSLVNKQTSNKQTKKGGNAKVNQASGGKKSNGKNKAVAGAAVAGAVAGGAAVVVSGAGKSKSGGGSSGGGGGGKTKLPFLRGVNRAGTEFACIKGDGIFEGPVDDAAIENMKKWKINVVRVPLNEDCWLGLNLQKPEYGGTNYQKAIKEYVERLRKHKLYVIVDLHWTEGIYQGKGQGACVDEAARCQKPMPDLKNAPKFWESVAGMFKNDQGVIFDLFNEPFPDMVMPDKKSAWECWQKGAKACTGFKYDVAGMQHLVDAVRKAGAKNLVLLGGLEWANDLDGWLDHLPKDEENNMAASMHSYDENACKDEGCWNKGIGKIVEKYPVIVGEIGDHGCKHDHIDKIMNYLDSKKINYLAWTFNVWDCGSGPALITNWNGDATTFGDGFKSHLAKVAT